MSAPSVRKTYQEKLKPTPAQERELERVLWRCRILYNTALEQRITLWRQRGVSLTRYQQEAELKDLRAERRDCAAPRADAYDLPVLHSGVAALSTHR